MKGGRTRHGEVALRPRVGFGRAAFFGTALGVAAAGAFLATFVRTSEWDTFFHLALGRELVRQGGFPAEDPFLYPLAGLPAGAQPGWLGSLAIYASWLLGGDAGPVWLVAGVGAALFVLLLRDALDGEATFVALGWSVLPVALALAVYRERASARPEMFGNLLLVTTLVALRRHAAGRSRLLLLFPALAILWSSLHPSLPAGLAAVGIFVLVNAALLAARRAWPRLPAEVDGPHALALPALAGAAGLLAACLLTPGGAAPLLDAAELLRAAILPAEAGRGGEALALVAAAVDELRPLSARQWAGPFGWLVALAAASFVLSGRTGNAREALTCAAFVGLAASAQRFAATAALVLAPIAARHLRVALDAVPRRAGPAVRGALAAAAAGGIAAAGWHALMLPDVAFGAGPSRAFPARAVEYLRAIGFEGKAFNTFHFGGYLAWSLDRKVFQDGRGGLLPADAAAALAGPSAYGRFAALDARHGFDALVVHYPQFTDAAFAALAALPPGSDWGADRRVWSLVAFDDGGQVYLRRDGAYAAEAARDEFRWARPANALALPQWGDRAGLHGDLARSLREAPDCLRCGTMLGFLLVDEGRPAEAEPLLLRATGGLPETRLYALLGLARAAEARGDRRTAEGRWRELVRVAPEPAWSRRRLANLLLEDRREDEAWSEIRRNLASARATVDDVVLAWRIASARGDEPAVRELAARLGRPPGGPSRASSRMGGGP